LAVSTTHDVLEDVTLYLKRSKTAVGRIVPLTIHPQPGPTAVERGDGLHALQLAQDLSLRIRARSPQERARPLHLFAAAPNALLFFLGQLARSFGEVQLYEHDFGSGKPGAYVRSLRLPVG
ncbi:SAVED domain-containing protein, partial [bacterium]